MPSYVLPKNRTIIVVFDLIGLSSENNVNNQFVFAIRKKIYKNLKNIKKIIVISEYVKKQLKEKFQVSEESIIVIKPGINTNVFAPLTSEKRNIIKRKIRIGEGVKILLYVGDEVPRKNLKTIIGALTILKNKGLNFLFIKVGKASRIENRIDLLSQINIHNLNEDFLLIDTVTDLELNELYNIADVFLFPSLDEGFGLPPLEAMAAGAPVIVTKLSSLPEVVGDAGIYLSNPTDKNELAEKIIFLLQNDEKRNEIINKGFMQVNKFELRRSSTSFYNLLTNIII